MSKPKIAQKAPYVMDVEAASYFFCTCGESSNQPYCDGKHKGGTFRPMKVDFPEPKKVAWCGCKNSNNLPFCDGSHSQL